MGVVGDPDVHDSPIMGCPSVRAWGAPPEPSDIFLTQERNGNQESNITQLIPENKYSTLLLGVRSLKGRFGNEYGHLYLSVLVMVRGFGTVGFQESMGICHASQLSCVSDLPRL